MSVVRLAHCRVDVPPCHRDYLTRVKEARRTNQAIINRCGKRVVAAADIAHSGEPAVERKTKLFRRVRRTICRTRRSTSLEFTSLEYAWMWGSISPGIRVFPATSKSRAQML